MRQLGTFPDAFQASALADHLLTLRIETRVEQQPDGYILWVCDEDRIAQARQELDAFQKNPRDRRYVESARAAATIRKQEDEVEQEYERRQTELREVMAEPTKRQSGQPFTMFLIAAAVFVFVSTHFGEDKRDPTMQNLFIAPFHTEERGTVPLIIWNYLGNIKQGEVWRLVTPALIHFNFPHLLFNILMLHQLGGAFEQRRGTWRYVLFVLAVAAGSNVAEYYLGWMGQLNSWMGSHGPNPVFGGLSGVNYALFGYAWMKSRYQPQLGFALSPTFVFIMIGWFLICFTGEMGPVANLAHAVGLGLGVLIGVAPTLWRGLRVSRTDSQEPDPPIV